jgi:hypothetical protein
MPSNLHKCRSDKKLPWLLALLLPLAIAPQVLLAQVPDPTGAWLIRTNIPTVATPAIFFLNVFHQGGTLTGDIQGESAFDPHATIKPKLPFNLIDSPQSGVWQKTGFHTFAATWLLIEYQDQTKPPAAPVFRFLKNQYTGRLNLAGNTMEFDGLVTFFGVDGNQQNPDGTPGTEGFPFKGNGIRIPLEIVPNSVHQLPIPPIPQ